MLWSVSKVLATCIHYKDRSSQVTTRTHRGHITFSELTMEFIFSIFSLCLALRVLISPAQVSCGNLLFRNEIHELQDSVTSCIDTVVQRYFGRGSIICVATSGYLKKINGKAIVNSTFHMIMDDVMNGVSHSVMVKRAISEKSAPNFASFEKVHNYLMFVESAEDFELTVNMLMKSPSWNPHGNFLVYLTGIKMNWKSIVNDIFAEVWKYFVINITILVPDVSANHSRFITWMPFDAGNCGKEDIQFIQLGVCQGRKILPTDANVFPVKVRGCHYVLGELVSRKKSF